MGCFARVFGRSGLEFQRAQPAMRSHWLVCEISEMNVSNA